MPNQEPLSVPECQVLADLVRREIRRLEEEYWHISRTPDYLLALHPLKKKLEEMCRTPKSR